MRAWKSWLHLLGMGSSVKAGGPGIVLDGDMDGVLLHIAFGPEFHVVDGETEAVLPGVGVLTDIVDIVRFAGNKRLPVDGWICSGLGAAPYSVREIAVWLSQVEAVCGPGWLVVQTSDLTEAQRRRLVDELVRRGCRLHEPCAIESSVKRRYSGYEIRVSNRE